MNSNFRNFAIWVFIGLLLVALFNLFQSPGVHVRGNEISFSQLLSEVEGWQRPGCDHRRQHHHRAFHRRPQLPDLCAERSRTWSTS